jgi:tetratricopeptide (TPR) repeat protein
MLTDSEDAAAVACDLGDLALALEQGGAYIAKIRVSFLEYRRRWESRKEEVLAWHDERVMKYPSSVAVTWLTTFEQLSESERKLLNIAAWFAPEPVPVSLLEGNIVDGADARDALAGLASWSLARWMADGEGFTVHRLVQEITRQRFSDNENRDSLDSAVTLLDRALPSPEWDQKGWQLWERLAPHCHTLLNRLQDHVLEPKAVRIMNQYGVWLRNRGQYTNAEPIFQRALAIRTKAFGKEHPDTLTSRINLAETLYAQGDLAGARALEEQVLEARARLLGKEHPDTLNSMNNLAQTLYAQGDLAGARALEEQVLEAMARLLGNEHPNTLTSMNNLAQTLYAQGDLAGARTLQEQVLGARARLLGKEHPDTLTSRLNLAGTLYAQGDLAGARTLQEQVLEAMARLWVRSTRTH